MTMVCLTLIAGSLRQLFVSLEFEHRIFSFQLFISILLLYMVVLMGFGIIYFSLLTQGYPVFQEADRTYPGIWIEDMFSSMYFSGVTLFTVGYGDLVPVGIGRWIAILEAMVGYSLPAALVAKVWQNVQRDR
ncbi:potassium channel family protein [Halobacillus yeomjeoni]|nr:potassium channel family protein [Halobacillus yeomjeoni]MCA0984011.1 potassium channel family protein [Halobacillus yeomjeoni]